MMSAPIYPSLVNSYARAIYLDGTKRFSDIRAEYVIPVKQYAATGVVNGAHYPLAFNGYTDEQLTNALTQGWISQQEYDETIAYRV
jgi:hypothetical protein